MTKTETRAVPSPTVDVVDSGRYRVYGEPVPEPVYHPIPQPPAQPPFATIFIPTNLRARTRNMGETAMFLWKLERKVVSRLCVHFGRPVVVAPSGEILFDEPLQTAGPRAIVLRIDIQSHLTAACAMRLPKDRNEPIKDLRTQFPLEPWKLCLVREEDPAWHDHIFFVEGKLVLGSVVKKARPELFT